MLLDKVVFTFVVLLDKVVVAVVVLHDKVVVAVGVLHELVTKLCCCNCLYTANSDDIALLQLAAFCQARCAIVLFLILMGQLTKVLKVLLV